jgi:hypothetical protein
LSWLWRLPRITFQHSSLVEIGNSVGGCSSGILMVQVRITIQGKNLRGFKGLWLLLQPAKIDKRMTTTNRSAHSWHDIAEISVICWCIHVVFTAFSFAVSECVNNQLRQFWALTAMENQFFAVC